MLPRCCEFAGQKDKLKRSDSAETRRSSRYELANAIGVRVADLIADEAVEAAESEPPDMARAAQATPKPNSY